jgi:hypothetical protein
MRRVRGVRRQRGVVRALAEGRGPVHRGLLPGIVQRMHGWRVLSIEKILRGRKQAQLLEEEKI